MQPTSRYLALLAVLSIHLCTTRSAPAANASLTPQTVADAGFVGSFTMSYYYDDVSTGRLIFAIMEPETRGFVRFDTAPIPAGSTIDGVRLVFWVSNHDLDGRAPCDKGAHIVQADVDPLVAPGVTTFGAIGAGNTYASFTVARTGPLYCMEYFEEWDLDLGPSAMADLEAGLPNGYFTVGLQSEWPCDVSQDHVDWIGFNESLTVPDVGCTLLDRPGSRMRLEVEFTPPVGGCLAGDLSPIELLKGARNGAGAAFAWLPDPDPFLVEYHLNTVGQKQALNDSEAHLPPLPGIADLQCVSPAVPNPGCDDADALADGDLLYYQVFSACGGSGTDEGPFSF